MWLVILLIVLIIILTYFLIKRNQPVLPIVLDVDLAKYQGTWYEIYRLPNPFQKNCVESVAMYKINPDGNMGVVNRCIKDGKINIVNGIAIPVFKKLYPNSNIYPGSFTVKFDGSPFGGDYNIIAIDNDYTMALVGTANRKYLWILSRTKQANPSEVSKFLNYSRSIGYDINLKN